MTDPIVILEIEDFLLNRQLRKVKLYRGQLFLTALNPKEPLSRARIGVVESADIPKDERLKDFGVYVTLSPYYEVKKDGKTGLITATRIPKYQSSLYGHAFSTVWNGNARFISRALRHSPFQGLESLADSIQRLDVPYNITLQELFEKPAEEMAESGI